MSEQSDFNIFVGAETGILKGVNVNEKCTLAKNFEKIANLTKESSISTVSLGEDTNEILVGLRSQMVKVFDVKDKCYVSTVETKGGIGPLVGVARFDGALVTAAESGTVTLWKSGANIIFNAIDTEVNSSGKLKLKNLEWTEEQKQKHAENLKIGRKLSRMRLHRTKATKLAKTGEEDEVNEVLMAVGGKEVELQVWNLAKPQAPLFRAKNVRSDSLEMRVPVWVSDFSFLSDNAVATCSKYGHIRKYDIRGTQRRPVKELFWSEKDEKMTCTACHAVNENQVIVGTSTGKLALWDFRNAAGYRGLIRKYKGCVGAVREISSCGTESDNGYFCVVGLDRYLRVYTIKEEKPLFNTYLKSRLTGVLMMPNFDPYAKPVQQQQQDSGVEDDDDIIILEDDNDDITATSPKQTKGSGSSGVVVESSNYTVTVAQTKLENLLSLPESDYKNKRHVFHEFFVESRQARKLLKTTDSDAAREQAMATLREQFSKFQQAHSTKLQQDKTGCSSSSAKSAKRRKVDLTDVKA